MQRECSPYSMLFHPFFIHLSLFMKVQIINPSKACVSEISRGSWITYFIYFFTFQLDMENSEQVQVEVWTYSCGQ